MLLDMARVVGPGKLGGVQGSDFEGAGRNLASLTSSSFHGVGRTGGWVFFRRMKRPPQLLQGRMGRLICQRMQPGIQKGGFLSVTQRWCHTRVEAKRETR